MNTSTEHILQCNQSEPLADASGRIVDLMNENSPTLIQYWVNASCLLGTNEAICIIYPSIMLNTQQQNKHNKYWCYNIFFWPTDSGY